MSDLKSEIYMGLISDVERERDNLQSQLSAAQAEIAEQGKIIDFANQEVERIKTCRDHWKTSFEHERENVIRLRQLLYAAHGGKCLCVECELVRVR